MRRTAFTIIELLIVVAIIGALIGMLLPAIQAAREASRRSHCANNLKQIGLGLLLYHDQHSQFPSGGWGHEWLGMADRGHGPRQPGGWVYNLLPCLEQQSLHDLGSSNVAEGYTARLQQPVPVFTCPTRRECKAWPISARFPYMASPKPAGAPQALGRGDYAINGGATLAKSHSGPADLATGDSPFYVWPDLSGLPGKPETEITGISHVRTGTPLRKIEDGASQTYLAGEKYLEPLHYENGESYGDNESLHSGYCSDNHRFTRIDFPPAQDGDIPTSDLLAVYRFGSAHPAGLNMVYCDGSVHLVRYEISPEVHYLAGHVADRGFVMPKGF